MISRTAAEMCGSQPEVFCALSPWHMNSCPVGTKLRLFPARGLRWVGCAGGAGGTFGFHEKILLWISCKIAAASPRMLNSLCVQKISPFSSELGFLSFSYATQGCGGWTAQTQLNNALSRTQNPHVACQNSAPSISLFVPRLALPRDQR